MFLKINSDHARFRQIVRGKVKDNLKKYITRGEMFGRKGKDIVSIPMPTIELPHFQFGDNKGQGVGSGDGQAGQSMGPGQGEAGDAEGQHVREVDINLDDLAQMMAEELGLPNIEPRGNKNIWAVKDK